MTSSLPVVPAPHVVKKYLVAGGRGVGYKSRRARPGKYMIYRDGVPSGPNYLLFSDADRLSDALRDRSVVG